MLMGNSRISQLLVAILMASALGLAPARAQQLPGTQPLTRQGDLSLGMLEDMRAFLLKQTASSVERRQALWHRDFSSRGAYEASILPNRERFQKIIGLIDQRVPFAAPETTAPVGGSSMVATGSGYKVYAVVWPVLPGVDAEGLLLEPDRPAVAQVVALPDADWSPEMLVGLANGVPAPAQFARRLAENGCRVLVPTLLDRQDTWSGNPAIATMTNETHREFIYRMAFDVGRHPIGYEVQKILAAVDWFSRRRPATPLGVAGYGEGGLLALYSAAVDTRIDAAMVSGYFQSRQEIREEPIYRSVWGLLHEFGDAEITSLIAPRALVIEAARGPEVPGPPPITPGRRDAAAPGRLVSPALADVRAEFERAQPFFTGLHQAPRFSLVVSGDGQGAPGSQPALQAFLQALEVNTRLRPSGVEPLDQRTGFQASERLHRQFDQLVNFTESAVRGSQAVRQQFWSKADTSSIEKWKESTEPYKRYLWEEVFGKLPDPSEPMAAYTRQIYDEALWRGYEVVLPVWRGVYAYGILLLPKDLKPGERRPVVVCQHGRQGRPQDLIEPARDAIRSAAIYHRYAATLADHGFIVYCPQNPYLGEEKFRSLQRIANPLKLSLFSFILGQHQRTLAWLAAQPFVDPSRIAFYGLSYGGKTAVRVPPLLDRYALSICSGDFTEYAWKISSYDYPYSFLFTLEYEMVEFNLANTFDYADMANLMAPRPFMVERGHNDGVSIDEWVAFEYAKVRRHYDALSIPDRTRIEFFKGPHTIHGVGTFGFLYQFLDWTDH